MLVPILTLDEALALRHRAPVMNARGKPIPPDFGALNAITNRIAIRFHDADTFRRLTPGEQAVYNLGFVLDGEWYNGGFWQYLTNSSGDAAEQAKTQLHTIGMPEVAAIFSRLSALFHSGVIPSSRTERNAVVDAAIATDEPLFMKLMKEADDTYDALAPRLYKALVDYVERHRADFAEPNDDAVHTRRDTASGEFHPEQVEPFLMRFVTFIDSGFAPADARILASAVRAQPSDSRRPYRYGVVFQGLATELEISWTDDDLDGVSLFFETGQYLAARIDAEIDGSHDRIFE